MDCTTCCGCCCSEMPEAARLMLIGTILTYVLGDERLNHRNNYNLGFCRLKSANAQGRPLRPWRSPKRFTQITQRFHLCSKVLEGLSGALQAS